MNGPFAWCLTRNENITPNGPCIEAIAPKIGCTPQTLRTCVKQAEVDEGCVDGVSTSDRERMKAMERELKGLRRANEILHKASAYFPRAELDHRPK